MNINVPTNRNPETASMPTRLLRRGIGIGAAAALLTAGAASAAPDLQQHSTPTGATALSAAAPAKASPYGTMNASPRTLTPGQRITISGNAPKRAHAGEWLVLESDAFASNINTNGIPTVRAQVLTNGTYTVTATIKPGLLATTYAIMGLYKGKPLDATAWIKVRPYSSIAATPRLAKAGQRITITGNAPKNARAGQWVTLKSHAFSSRFTSGGIPSIRAQILVNGSYRVTVTLRRTLSPTGYTVRGTYMGQPLDTVARITVR
jgi:hypothetical protein